MVCESGLSQSEIAKRLDMSQGQVSKLIQRAYLAGWFIQSKPKFNSERLAPGEIDDLRKMCYPRWDELKDVLKPKKNGEPRVRNIRIIETGSRETEAKAYDRRLEQFGKRAAMRIVELLPRMQSVGISWGKTLRFICDNVVQTISEGKSLPDPDKLRFFPVVGESLNRPNSDISASHLAARLHRAIRAKDDPISFGAVAACIPAKYKPHAKVIRDFFGSDAGFRRVFGAPTVDGRPHGGLVSCADTLILGVGTASMRVSDPYLDDTISLANISRAELDSLSIGNISGYFLERNPLSDEPAERLKDIKNLWTCINDSDIKHCAQRAEDNRNLVGVVVVAIGEAKVEVIRECAHRGMINELIVDQDLADALIKERAGV
jgi:hypothetical protein